MIVDETYMRAGLLLGIQRTANFHGLGVHVTGSCARHVRLAVDLSGRLSLQWIYVTMESPQIQLYVTSLENE